MPLGGCSQESRYIASLRLHTMLYTRVRTSSLTASWLSTLYAVALRQSEFCPTLKGETSVSYSEVSPTTAEGRASSNKPLKRSSVIG
jgi:hypothetical protein